MVEQRVGCGRLRPFVGCFLLRGEVEEQVAGLARLNGPDGGPGVGRSLYWRGLVGRLPLALTVYRLAGGAVCPVVPCSWNGFVASGHVGFWVHAGKGW